jgi:hypothetical protein
MYTSIGASAERERHNVSCLINATTRMYLNKEDYDIDKKTGKYDRRREEKR